MLLPGISGFSRELADIIERLPPVKLAFVVNVGLEIIESEYADDPEILTEIEAYRANPRPMHPIAQSVMRRSKECDEEYITLEQRGQIEESSASYRKMCVLDSLVELLAPPLNHCIVDAFLYSLAGGAKDLDIFVATILERVRKEVLN